MKVQAVKMIRNMMAPIEVWDGTTIPEAIQQAGDVFGSIPLPNVEPLRTQACWLLGHIDQKLMLHRLTVAQGGRVRYIGIGIGIMTSNHKEHLNLTTLHTPLRHCSTATA